MSFGDGRGLVLTVKTWFSHNLELVTDATDAADVTEVVSSTADRTHPSTRARGQDDVGFTGFTGIIGFTGFTGFIGGWGE